MELPWIIELLSLMCFCNIASSQNVDDVGNKPDYTNFPFWDHNLPIEERLDDLLKHLTLKEMVDQMANGGGYPDKPAPPIERLGIPPYNFDTECLRGIATMNSTSFPMPIGLAATFSPDILYDVAAAISTEARGIFNNASSRGDYGSMKGLNCFAPCINLVHHPMWGRLQEVFGEDPFLIGQLTASYVRGLQGMHDKYVRAIAGCKHALVHSGPENIPISRFLFDAKVNLRDLRVTYLPHFKACVEAGALNLMCSYNSINGIPACAYKTLLTDLFRGEYNFKGFIVSDMGAIENIATGHKYATTFLEAAALAANAGVDLELHDRADTAYSLLEEAVEKGLVSYATIYNRTRSLFYARMKLGLFDPPSLNPYTEIKASSVVQSPYHRQLAVEVATKSFVMLKNIGHRLPLLEGSIKKLGIIGPMADNLDQLFGGYTPHIDPKFSSTPYGGLKDAAQSTVLVPGCDSNKCVKYDSSAVINATQEADVVIVCLGTEQGNGSATARISHDHFSILINLPSEGQAIEGEDKDMPSMDLPGQQNQLLQDVLSHAKHPIVLLIFTGCPVDLRTANSSENVGAIIQCFFPAQATGQALRKVLFLNPQDGSVVSPSGRLPYSWPMTLDQVPPMVNYSMENRTYRYSTQMPLYSFGYGLSYSNFVYDKLYLSVTEVTGDTEVVEVNVQVKNVGVVDSEEVTQAYISWQNLPPSIIMPKIQLVAVSRNVIPASSGFVEVKLGFKAEQLKVWDDVKGFVFVPGFVTVYVGGQQPFQATSASSNIKKSFIHVVARSL